MLAFRLEGAVSTRGAFGIALVGALFGCRPEQVEPAPRQSREPAVLETPPPIVTGPVWDIEANSANERLGYSVAGAGDVNRDGYDDVVVGVPGRSVGISGNGEARLYLGTATGVLAPAWVHYGYFLADSHFGFSVAGVGDVNGDGASDVVVGIPFYGGATINPSQGRAELFLGSSGGLQTNPAWFTLGPSSSLLGRSVAGAGDVNGDGFADVIIGAPYYSNGEINEGRAFVYLGGASGLSTIPTWAGEPNQAGANGGSSVSTAGDVNGDGYDDVIVGAPAYTNGQSQEGRAFVYLGTATGVAAAPAWTAESDQANSQFGFAVSTAGDVNDDGYDDVVIGAQTYANGQANEGRAYVYLGSATGLAATPVWTQEGNLEAVQFGYSVTGADVNHDGYSDVIVGAPATLSSLVNRPGSVTIYLGSAAGPSLTASFVADGTGPSRPGFGWSVARAGDVNGDDIDDLVVGSPYYSGGQLGEGRAVSFHGTCGTADADSDGTPDCADGCPADPLKTAPGLCGCGVADTNTDGDSLPNCTDGCDDDPNKTVPGVCGCGVADTDSDSDGTPNCDDACPSDPNKIAVGACGCGVPDTNSDGDSLPNCTDGCDDDPNKTVPGVCGCGVADTDGDSDGTLDCDDACPADPGKIVPGICGCGSSDADADADGTPNCDDGCPSDPDKLVPGNCGCGIAESVCADNCPNDPNKTAPGICGCGVSDADTDSDGTPDCHDGCPTDSTKLVPGACGCGQSDADSDGDGTPNCSDDCPNDASKTAPGTCGCGAPETDTDGDHSADCVDGCASDPQKTMPGTCGCGVVESAVDGDGDGTPDCRDECPMRPAATSDGCPTGGEGGAGGESGAGGEAGGGGEPATGGTTATGGRTSTGGRTGTGGRDDGGEGGDAGAGATSGSGGSLGGGSGTGAGGSSTGGTGGAPKKNASTEDDGGCGCRVAGSSRDDTSLALVAAVLASLATLRRRSSRRAHQRAV